jgi:hypothetical protein
LDLVWGCCTYVMGNTLVPSVGQDSPLNWVRVAQRVSAVDVEILRLLGQMGDVKIEVVAKNLYVEPAPL